MIEDVTRQGLIAYSSDPKPFEENMTTQAKEKETEEETRNTEVMVDGEEVQEEESSEPTIKKYKRPFWICQPYIRPLPKEALERGSLSLGKKARRKLEAGRTDDDDEGRGRESSRRRQERDERDGVPAPEVAKEAMVCG